MARKLIGQSLPQAEPQPQPDEVTADTNGPQPGQLAMDFKNPIGYIEDLHAALQAGVAAAGGVVKVAEKVKKSHGEISLRIRREQDGHGAIQRATLDLVGEVASMGGGVRKAMLDELHRRWGFKPAEPLYEPSGEEKFRMLIGRLRGTAAGEAILRDAAEETGYDPNIFRR